MQMKESSHLKESINSMRMMHRNNIADSYHTQIGSLAIQKLQTSKAKCDCIAGKTNQKFPSAIASPSHGARPYSTAMTRERNVNQGNRIFSPLGGEQQSHKQNGSTKNLNQRFGNSETLNSRKKTAVSYFLSQRNSHQEESLSPQHQQSFDVSKVGIKAQPLVSRSPLIYVRLPQVGMQNRFNTANGGARNHQAFNEISEEAGGEINIHTEMGVTSPKSMTDRIHIKLKKRSISKMTSN